MTPTAKILLLGSGELGREFVISAKRLGAYVIACDSYADAPAMQIVTAVVTWGWRGHNGAHSAFDHFTFIRVPRGGGRADGAAA